MKDVRSTFAMRWMEKHRVPLHTRCSIIDMGGFSCFMLLVLFCILAQEFSLTSPFLVILMTMAYAFLAYVAGYFFYISCTLWIPLLLFGIMDIVMALCVDAGQDFTAMFFTIGAGLCVLGLCLMPSQLRARKRFNQIAAAAQGGLSAQTAPSPATAQEEAFTAPVPAPQSPRSAPVSRPAPAPAQAHAVSTSGNLPRELLSFLLMQSSSDGARILADAKRCLGEKLLGSERLWTLDVSIMGAHPHYLGQDGRFELFTGEYLAEIGKQALHDRLGVPVEIRCISGREAIHAFFCECVHSGFEVFRLNSGSSACCRLRLSDFFNAPAAQPVDRQNRPLRHLLHRAKLYAALADRQDDASPAYRSLCESALTMRMNAYRELSRGVVYVLAGPMGDAPFYSTAAAQKIISQSLIKDGDDKAFWENLPRYDKKLNMFYVSRPGEEGDASKGLLCVFTDLAQAQAAREMFQKHGMDCCVLLTTWELMIHQARECAGLIADMQTISFEIPASEYDKISSMRTLDAPIVVRLKENFSAENASSQSAAPSASAAPLLRKTGMTGAWKQFAYQWPHRFGFDYMLDAAQWLADHDLLVKTLVTADHPGASETEHIAKLPENGGKVRACIPVETGSLAVGGFSKSARCLMKVYWYNQTNVVSVFTAGDIPEEAINRFAAALCQAGMRGFADCAGNAALSNPPSIFR